MMPFLSVAGPVFALLLFAAAYLWHAYRADRRPGSVLAPPPSNTNVKRIGEWS